ncbi:DUF2339 domain-containing protein [Capnocytophaga sputigena]|uniref:DUF2339 domain-containing protein n=1 Tax=Capnocytophaga sputigena TaxID=1019 RepID=UPI0028D7D355|nr:DUF2339 domain-containing protein [Capnocytophaga sputigena]
MITDKELESLMRKVDGAVDRQYDFIREMKGIKNYLWELKATMQESLVEETITPPIVETTVAPIVPEVVEEEKLTPMVVEEKLTPAIIQENLTPAVMQEVAEETPEETVEKVTEEVTAEETTITPQPPVEEKQAYQSKKPDFEKQVDDWFKPKEAINWERFIGENLFSKIGIGIIIIGVFIGVKYSIEHNLISPAMRLVLSYLVGAGLFVAGAMLKKKYESFSAVLVSGAMTIFYFVTFIGYSVFNFFPQSLTFILMFLFTAFTVAASLNYNKVVIALIGLVGSYAVPFLLSDNSGRVSILFAYTAIINIGVLIISFYKQWRSLYLSAFVFTWLMLLSLSGNAYKYEDFTPYFIFNLVTFLTFYIAFIFQKIHQEKELKEIDVVLFLSNSLLFFGMGVWYIYDYYTMENRTIMAMFTLVNALLHFGVAYYFHVKKFPSQGLKYLILVLALSFATLVIPIQFKGSWITVFWSAEAALLFWFGRHKNLLVYERISYAVMVLASISLLIDWVKAPNILDIVNPDKFIYLTPFGNALFINTLLYSAAFGFMAYTHHLTQLANKEIYKILSIILNILCVASLYFIFFREISILCDVRALQQTPNLTNNYVAWEALNNFKTIWRTVYSLLFVTIYTLLNIRVFKSKQLGEIQFGISTLLTFIFMTLGLYTFSELRESYLDNPQLSLWFLNVRYVGIVVFAIFCYTSYLLSRFLNLKEEMQKSLEFVLHLIILWVASSELLHWTELYRSASNYKLGLTILWGSYALFLVVLGIFKRKKHLRISGIVLIGFSILKLFLYDTTHLDALRKTIVFVILGFLVLVASFFYNKYTNKIEETDKSENNETTDNNVTN